MLFLQRKRIFMKNVNIEQCPLFQGMTIEEQQSILNCFKGKEKRYQKNEYIIHAGETIQYIFVVLSGAVNIIEDDYWGNRSIIDYLLPNQTFGISYAYANIHTYPISVIAKTNTKILCIDINKMFNPCSKHCIHHNQLIRNAVAILSEQNIVLINKIEHLSKRTTKEKILAFLSYSSKKAGSNSFDIPLNRQELADYLSVDRSALSNELSKLKRTKLIDYHKNHFTLYFIHTNKNIDY